MAETYDIQLQQPRINEMSFDERLALLVDSEIAGRENRYLARLIRGANLPEPAALEDIDLRPGRGLDKSYIATLGTCEWVRRQQPVVLVGPTGAGKTWLGAAMITQACRLRMSARWYQMSDLLEEIAVRFADGSLMTFKKALVKPRILAIDDFGLGEIDPVASGVLLSVVDRRLRAGGSLLVTSQFPVEKWHGLFPDPSVADAILDRIIHSAHVLTLKGESMRKLKARKK
jgi:DNA replication protein DnaC